MDYLDFELEIQPGNGPEYPVTVVRSPAGEARSVMRFPFDTIVLENHLLRLQNALLRSGGTRRTVLTPEEKSVQTFGAALFDALFSGEVRSRFAVSCDRAEREGCGLRIKLRILDPRLAALPWEFLYDAEQAEYLSLSRNSPIVRYLDVPQRVPSLRVTPPLKILGMNASPRDQSGLDADRERARVETAVAGLVAQGDLELTWLEGQSWRDLQGALQTQDWHIFHFVGHGAYDKDRDEGLIAMAGADGGTEYLAATQLARLLADQRSLRLVVLNTCEGARGGEIDIFSSTASILVRRGIPAVLAMQYQITDSAAIETAKAFYEALTRGLPVDAAVSEARKAVSLAVWNTVEWGTPVLYMRTPDGVLFDVQKASSATGAGIVAQTGRAELGSASGSGAVGETPGPIRTQEAPPQSQAEVSRPPDAPEQIAHAQTPAREVSDRASISRRLTKSDFVLWSEWLAATAAGWILLGILWTVLPADSDVLQYTIRSRHGEMWFLACAVVGTAVGIAQWLILRQKLSVGGWWVLATAGGYLLIAAPIDLVGDGGEALPLLFAGIIAGVFQWFALRRRTAQSGLWLVAWIAAFGLALGYYYAATYSSPLTVSMVIGGMGLIIGGITGGALVWLVRRAQGDSRAIAARPAN